jgi:hypothetical protein
MMGKHYESAYNKVLKVYEDVAALDPCEKHRGEATVAMTNLMLAQAINQLRLDLNSNFDRIHDDMKFEDDPEICDEAQAPR